MALVTGSAVRIGSSIVEDLHSQGLNVVVNYRTSAEPADALVAKLNRIRPDSALALAADIRDPAACKALADGAYGWSGRLDVLVNNASTFYPTPIENASEEQWNDLFGSNLKGPFFLAQATRPALAEREGCIINLLDVWVIKTLAQHPVYSAAKAGLASLTRTLALDLAPEIRVNGVAPGAILWPADEPDPDYKAATLARVPLGRMGTPQQIARAVRYLALEANYVTGQTIPVDGGASLR
ncbi:MAG: pteridine reductase [Pseudomonadota bacterium]